MLVSKQIYFNSWQIRLDQNSIMDSGGEGVGVLEAMLTQDQICRDSREALLQRGRKAAE